MSKKIIDLESAASATKKAIKNSFNDTVEILLLMRSVSVDEQLNAAIMTIINTGGAMVDLITAEEKSKKESEKFEAPKSKRK